MEIQYLKHNEIDFEKYDACISESPAANTYALSWYLNIVSPNWTLLMAKEYAYVMPLPQKSKFGFKYLTQAYFCQQLGVFAKKNLNQDVFIAFLKAVPYKYARLQFNTSNVFGLSNEKLRPNYVLKLSRLFFEISSHFTTNCQRNIKKSKSLNQEIKDIAAEEFMLVLKQNNSGIFNEQMLSLQEQIIKASLQNGSGRLLAAISENNIIAAVFIINAGKRIYYLCPVSSPEGKQKQSMSLLVNDIIEKNAGSEKTLDFEGSAISGVAKFYAGFGAKPEYYPIWKKLGF